MNDWYLVTVHDIGAGKTREFDRVVGSKDRASCVAQSENELEHGLTYGAGGIEYHVPPQSIIYHRIYCDE